MPASKSRATLPIPRPRSIPSQIPATTTGTKMIAGRTGWTREKKSRKRLSNIGGEAESWADRSCAIGADLTESDLARRVFGLSGSRDPTVKEEERHCGNAPDGAARKWHDQAKSRA